MLRSGGLLLFLPLLAALCPLFPAHSQQAAEAGVITIESDLQSADNSTGVITASGNVRLVHADRGLVATSRQAQYFTEEDRIVLSGDVDVIQTDGNLLRADRFTYLLEEGRAIANPLPGQQVFSQWTLQPSQPVLDGAAPSRGRHCAAHLHRPGLGAGARRIEDGSSK